MRTRVFIKKAIDRDREFNRKFGQLANYEMIDNNVSWEEAKRIVRNNLTLDKIWQRIEKQ